MPQARHVARTRRPTATVDATLDCRHPRRPVVPVVLYVQRRRIPRRHAGEPTQRHARRVRHLRVALDGHRVAVGAHVPRVVYRPRHDRRPMPQARHVARTCRPTATVDAALVARQTTLCISAARYTQGGWIPGSIASKTTKANGRCRRRSIVHSVLHAGTRDGAVAPLGSRGPHRTELKPKTRISSVKSRWQADRSSRLTITSDRRPARWLAARVPHLITHIDVRPACIVCDPVTGDRLPEATELTRINHVAIIVTYG